MPAPLEGGCGCGAVRFRIDQPLVVAAYCHCTRCQRRTGSAFAASAFAAPGSVTLLQGEEHLGRWQPGGFDKVFCKSCGSALFAQDGEDGEIRIVRLGAIDGDPGIKPSLHQFTDYAVSWQDIPDDGLPRHPERAPAIY